MQHQYFYIVSVYLKWPKLNANNQPLRSYAEFTENLICKIQNKMIILINTNNCSTLCFLPFALQSKAMYINTNELKIYFFLFNQIYKDVNREKSLCHFLDVASVLFCISLKREWLDTNSAMCELNNMILSTKFCSKLENDFKVGRT